MIVIEKNHTKAVRLGSLVPSLPIPYINTIQYTIWEISLGEIQTKTMHSQSIGITCSGHIDKDVDATNMLSCHSVVANLHIQICI